MIDSVIPLDGGKGLVEGDIRVEVYQRVILARSLYQSGAAACRTPSDRIAFAKGILLLHDAVEAMLGAVADHLHARLTRNTSLLDYYELISEADPQRRPVPYKTQMRNLNSLRIGVKHHGILPDPATNSHFPQTVYSLLEDLCETYFGVDLSSVCLKSLIKNKDVLQYIELAEDHIEKEDIENALISLAYAMYYICESSTIPWVKDEPFAFTEYFRLEHTVNLIQHGVDPYLYYRFKNLTPVIGRARDTKELFYWWDKTYGHPANWTVRNARFCLDFCIDTALKFQKEEYGEYDLVPYFAVYEDVIEPAGEQATLWDQSFYPRNYFPYQPPPPKKAKLVLRKGQSIVGWALDDKDRLLEWMVISDDIPHEEKYGNFGFVLKEEVKVTRRKKTDRS